MEERPRSAVRVYIMAIMSQHIEALVKSEEM